MCPKGFTVDLCKPHLFQVGYLGEHYDGWVHQPIITKESPRFFQSEILEWVTRSVWWVVPVIWIPMACWCISISIRMGHSSSNVALMVVFGIFVWTFLEYLLHRFLFHFKTKTYWGNTIHYLLHGLHHKFPMDRFRLVMPPLATALFSLLFWHLFHFVGTPSTAPAVFGGTLLGYVIYDLTHYYLHHGQPSTLLSKSLKKYHLSHHFKVQDVGFGITSTLWDIVFGTLPPIQVIEKKE
ncbi:dihydroceramide fatty acyl 2-hydroxylase FAH1 isoform X2 [Jatropha curcas]|nr:dihydroceramide fatty acyl 2-hydroxylase FAH1 isoform X2 [Jatropha curcas]